ncbi:MULTISPECIES: hypothetical protein [unclassified Streptomyces]|uniref:hypothetical protein n=1 Tax=unclassified Streptomyces TaxID=2593676 RepID=UPI00224DBC09|nr:MULTISPECIES: hypothetical protein [unclassified Streptomyces]MCX4829757.1 hypothetical protein [Streptomyces sp. NBC_01016]
MIAFCLFLVGYDSGHVGTRGKFTATSCAREQIAPAHGHTTSVNKDLEVFCRGTFRSDGGSDKGTSTTIKLTRDTAPAGDGDAYLSRLLDSGGKGTKLTVGRLDGGGFLAKFLDEYHPANSSATARSAALVSLGVALLGLGAFAHFANWPRPRGKSPALSASWRQDLGTGTRGVVTSLVAVGVVGVLASLIIMLNA